MAITKKHQAIQAKKTELRAQIVAARQEAKTALHKIPQSVVQGSHNVAVEYKRLALEVVELNENYEGPEKSSTKELLDDLKYYTSLADKMHGRAAIL